MTAEPNVISALASVQSEIGGIEKRRGGEGGISYAYRGIDAIASAAQPLLGAAGVVIVPIATLTKVEQVTVNGKPWTDTFVDIEWAIYGPGGAADMIGGRTQGIGRDNSDKGYNKAATQAFKNLLLRLLCIGDPQDDADAPEHQNNATDARPEPIEVDDPARLEAVRVFGELGAMTDEAKAEFKAWKGARPANVGALMDAEWRAEVEAWMHQPGEVAS